MDRDQTDFDLAVQEIGQCLGLSPGAAQAKLREFCASGVVRSWWTKVAWWVHDAKTLASLPQLIRPSDWKSRELDLAIDIWGYEGPIVVSKTDLDQQINGQEDSSRNAEIVKQFRKGQNPPKNISWKKFYEIIRKQCNAKSTDRGFSDDRIEKITRRLRKEFDQSI